MWFQWLEPLTVNQHLASFGFHGPFASKDTVYLVFLRDLERPFHCKVMQIFAWELLAGYQIICDVTLQNHMKDDKTL